MSDPGPAAKPRSHRAPPSPATVVRRLVPPVVAVLVVLGVIAVLVVLNGHSTGGPSPAVVSGVARSHAPSASPSASPSAAATAATAATPPPVPSASTTPTSRRSTGRLPHRPRAARTAASRPATAPAYAPIEVLNNSRVTGLAHHVAAELESRGFQVWRVGNLQGRIAESTVYYAPGRYAAAEHLARSFGSVQRIEPNSALGLSGSGLTLVTTAAWQS